MKIIKKGRYIYVKVKDSTVAGYSLITNKMWGCTRYFRALEEWIDGNTMRCGDRTIKIKRRII